MGTRLRENREALRILLWRAFPRAMLLTRYIHRFRQVPNLWRPRGFTEHLLVRMLFDRDPRLALFADKLTARAYAKARLGGEENLTTLYAVVDTAVEIRRLALPERFVMKPNHMSGAFRIVSDATSVQRSELEALAASWLNRRYGVAPYEWAYRGIRPRVLFEELLEHNGVLPIDYNIHCFDGEPRFVRVWRGKFGPEITVITYDTDFRQIPTWLAPSSLRRVREESDPPPNFDRMLEIARKLSKGSDYVRVDLYNLGGRVVFGELTNYPHAGYVRFDPPMWEEIFGAYWPSRHPG
jgi:hypothetical protein